MRGNSISIKGNLTRDCEVRTTPTGKNVVSWSVAWSKRRRTEEGEYENVPHYFDVECWATDAQLRIIQPLLVKGATCAVIDGHVEFQSWQAKDGSNRSRVVILCDDPVSGLMVNQPRQKKEPIKLYTDHVEQPVYDIPF